MYMYMYIVTVSMSIETSIGATTTYIIHKVSKTGEKSGKPHLADKLRVVSTDTWAPLQYNNV